MMQFNQAAALILMLISFNACAWSPFGPNNYEDCVLDGIKNAKSDQAANAVMFACRKKFPDKSQIAPTTKYDPPAVHLFSGLGMSRPTLNALISNIDMTQARVVQTGSNTYGVKSFDYGHHLSIEVTNRNDFSINHIEIGLNAKNSKCSWNDRDYSEIYSCSGQAEARTSGVFRCEIPRIETRKMRFCITGFGIYSNEDGVIKFKDKFGIPDRK